MRAIRNLVLALCGMCFCLASFNLCAKQVSISLKEQKQYLKVYPVTSPKFCPSFKKAAFTACHRHLRFVPFLWPIFCHSVMGMYREMVHHDGSFQRACNVEDKLHAKACLNTWTCYLAGGHDFDGHLCNGNGMSCLQIAKLKRK